MQTAPRVATNRFLSIEEFDAPVDAWGLDELYQLADLDSVRSARGHTDYAEAWRES
jgi:hypothetical protein